MLWCLLAVRNGLFACSADGESEGRSKRARRIATNVAKLPELLARKN
jgi:hypothetical protein